VKVGCGTVTEINRALSGRGELRCFARKKGGRSARLTRNKGLLTRRLSLGRYHSESLLGEPSLTVEKGDKTRGEIHLLPRTISTQARPKGRGFKDGIPRYIKQKSLGAKGPGKDLSLGEFRGAFSELQGLSSTISLKTVLLPNAKEKALESLRKKVGRGRKSFSKVDGELRSNGRSLKKGVKGKSFPDLRLKVGGGRRSREHSRR